LAQLKVLGGREWHDLLFSWPLSGLLEEQGDLRLLVDADVEIAVAPIIDLRSIAVQHLRGSGFEVGAGLSPCILSREGVDVRYVEVKTPDEWGALYVKDGRPSPVLSDDVRARYVIGSAVDLDHLASGNMDFIFCNHVFEHLPNPVRVIRNWLRALRPGGLIVGICPDPRYSFDCRQPITSSQEAWEEANSPVHEVAFEKYERWCRYTASDVSPTALMKRAYSIHVNFFTPQTFVDTFRRMKETAEISSLSVLGGTNFRDYLFVLRK